MFAYLLKSSALSKVVPFSWTLLLNRIPTCDNLALRNALSLDASTGCVLCGSGVETSTHIFLHCGVTSIVWSKILLWLELNFITLNNLFVHLKLWSEIEATKKGLLVDLACRYLGHLEGKK